MYVSPAGAGTVSVNSQIPSTYPYTNTYTSNSSVNLIAEPASGYYFDNWTGSISSSLTEVTVVMTCSKTITANFYAATTGDISGFVWQDDNQDGACGADETLISGVTVNLINSSGVTIASAISGTDGDYQFSDLTPATYQIRFVTPLDYNFSPQIGLNAANYAGMTDLFTLTAGQVNNIDAGIYRPGDSQFSVTLSSGWNLFSLPYYVASGTGGCTDVLDEILGWLKVVFAYQVMADSTGTWSGYIPGISPENNMEMEDGSGYWLDLTESANLPLSGEILPSDSSDLPVYQLNQGWNLVGFKSYVPIPAKDYFSNVKNKYSIIWSYQGGSWQTILDNDALTPGLGYWIDMTEDGIIYPYPQTYDNVTTSAAYTMIQEQSDNSDFVILDVRRPSDEYSAGHISGAINLDYSSATFQDELNNLDKSKTYMVYCKAGSRSLSAIKIMKQSGFIRTYNMIGGFDAWKANGFPWVQ